MQLQRGTCRCNGSIPEATRGGDSQAAGAATAPAPACGKAAQAALQAFTPRDNRCRHPPKSQILRRGAGRPSSSVFSSFRSRCAMPWQPADGAEEWGVGGGRQAVSASASSPDACAAAPTASAGRRRRAAGRPPVAAAQASPAPAQLQPPPDGGTTPRRTPAAGRSSGRRPPAGWKEPKQILMSPGLQLPAGGGCTTAGTSRPSAAALPLPPAAPGVNRLPLPPPPWHTLNRCSLTMRSNSMPPEAYSIAMHRWVLVRNTCLVGGRRARRRQAGGQPPLQPCGGAGACPAAPWPHRSQPQPHSGSTAAQQRSNPRASLNCTMLVWPDSWRWLRISRSTFLSTCLCFVAEKREAAQLSAAGQPLAAAPCGP